MKFPKKIRTYCPKCRKHTQHTVKLVKKRARGSAHPISKSARQKGRLKRGYGGHGKFSKPAVSKKPTQKVDLRLQCETCKKMHTKKGFRVKKFELV
ncbi:MAG: 50S ribosomal protein L44e [Candidatus Aenigmarchaeota archaeon]|nr:50S ribosomal protein L44e [Candidatus Aenigmarchaeota archaeon]